MPRPNAHPSALRRVLQQELALGQRMLTLAEDQTEALVENDLDRLNAIQADQQRAVAEHEPLEKARQALVRDLAWMAGMDRAPNLAMLMPHLPHREQETLGRLRRQILDVEMQTQRANARNRRLIESALEFAQFSLKVLTTAALQPARYGTNIATLAAPTFYIDNRC